MWQFSDFNLSFLYHLVSHRLNHFVQLATKTFVPAKAMLPPLPEVMGGLLDKIPCAEIIPPASPFENPARLAVLGENVYALAIAQVLLQYMSPQRLAAPAMRVSEFVPDACQYWHSSQRCVEYYTSDKFVLKLAKAYNIMSYVVMSCEPFQNLNLNQVRTSAPSPCSSINDSCLDHIATSCSVLCSHGRTSYPARHTPNCPMATTGTSTARGW